MTAFYGADPAAAEAESLRTIDKALELGVNFLDTAWVGAPVDRLVVGEGWQ